MTNMVKLCSKKPYPIWLFWSRPRFTSTFGVMKFTNLVSAEVKKKIFKHYGTMFLGLHNYEFSFSYRGVRIEEIIKHYMHYTIHLFWPCPRVPYHGGHELKIFAEWSAYSVLIVNSVFHTDVWSIFKFLINYQIRQFLPCPESSYRAKVMKFIIYIPFTLKMLHTKFEKIWPCNS